MERIITVCLLIFVGSFSEANAQTMFCSGDLCFIRLNSNSANTWSAAQERCKENNATLPIADNADHRMSFLDALSHLQIDTAMGVWLGAIASDDGPDNWHWLNGDRFTGTDVQQRGEYSKSYAYVAKKETEVKAYASPPNNSYSYICQYISPNPDGCTNGTGRTAFVRDNNRCYVRYDESLPWFSARNKCLLNNGDLASFAQLSLLDGIVDSSGFWVGLRSSHFDWRNEVTGESSDVTYTSWRNGQPNDAAPHCMSTDEGDFPNWRDIDCTNSYPYICQVSGGSTFSFPSTRVTISSTPSGSLSTTSSTSSTSTTTTSTTTAASSKAGSPMGTPERTSASTSSRNTTSDDDSQTSHTNLVAAGESNAKSKDNKDLAIGLGVGLGVPFLIIIVVIIIVVVIRRKRRNSAGNAHSTKKFVTSNGQNGAENGMEMTANKKKGRKHSDSTPAHYATVREANPGSKVDSPSSQDVGYYADLRFASQGS